MYKTINFLGADKYLLIVKNSEFECRKFMSSNRADNMSVKVIDWRITTRCNNTCGFCYATSERESVTSTQAKKVIDAIYNMNCETVCITGGEPLLQPSFAIEIMEKLHKLDITVYLSTNGTNYIANIDAIEPLISKLSLPLDGFDVVSNQINGRNTDSFCLTKEILDVYNKRTHVFPIKIATMLTKKNLDIDHFIGIYNFLKNYPIDLWKIYQFIPESRGEMNQQQYDISEYEWTKFIETLQPILDNDADSRQFNVAFTSRKERNSAYFIIQPDATVIVPVDDPSAICTEVHMGNLLTDDKNHILEKWQKRVNNINVIENAKKRHIIRPLHRLHIDDFDRELLSIFSKYPLLSNADLSKKITNTSKVTIGNRIQKLYQIRAIKRVIPIVNVAYFGFDVYLINLFFSTKTKRDLIVDILCRNPNIAWVAEYYDLNEHSRTNVIFRIALLAENDIKVDSVLKELKDIFLLTLVKHEKDIVPDKYVYDQWHILKKTPKPVESISHVSFGRKGINSINKTEWKLLQALHSIERPTLHDLAVQMKTNKKQIAHCMVGLEKKGIINKYYALFDSNVLGYKCYLLFVKFVNIDEKKAFEEYIKKKNEVSHINTLNSGKWDIDIEIKVMKHAQCIKLIKEFQNYFSRQISQTKLMQLEKEHKFEFLLPVVLNVAKNHVCTKPLETLEDEHRI